MAGTIVADIIQSDQSYASSINIASPMVVSNTLTMGAAAAISGNVNFDSGTLFVDATYNKVGVGTTNPSDAFHAKTTTSGNCYLKAECVDVVGEAGVNFKNPAGGQNTWIYRPSNSDSLNIYHNGATRWNLNSSGCVTLPYQPAFLAYKSVNETVSSGVQKVNLDSELYDVGSNFNTSTGRFTAPVAGTYMFSAIVARDTSTTNITYISSELRINGSRYMTSGWFNKASTTDAYSAASFAVPIRLNANDYVELGLEVNATSVLLGTYSYGCRLSGYLVG